MLAVGFGRGWQSGSRDWSDLDKRGSERAENNAVRAKQIDSEEMRREQQL